MSGCNGSCIIETLIATSNFFIDFTVRCTRRAISFKEIKKSTGNCVIQYRVR